MAVSSKGTALVTGASSGIGAAYAGRLARRGHDLILVARDRERLELLARRIGDETGREAAVLAADLIDPGDLAEVERVLRDDPAVTVLVNNAGVGATAPLLESDVGDMSRMIALNVAALMRLTFAAAPAFVARGSGTIVNIASIVAVAPETLNGVYGGTKAFVLAFSRSLQHELADKGVRVQGGPAGRHRDRLLERRRVVDRAAAAGDRHAGGRHGRRRPRRPRPRRVRDGAFAAGPRGLGRVRGRAARLAARPVPGDTGQPVRDHPRRVAARHSGGGGSGVEGEVPR
jgi:short-subunit dehydrogenase